MGERIVIFGATGGIGSALAAHAEKRGATVLRLGRDALASEAALAAAAEAAGNALSHVIVATGLLHRDGQGPERRWQDIDADWMLENFRINSVLPALVAKYFLPRLQGDRRSVFAVLTARIGSISDNRLGGWYSYRASKAAAHQIVRTLAIELARRKPHAIAVSLHPGTVDTGLSLPFQRNVAPEKLFTPAQSAAHLWAVIDALQPAQSGLALAFDGNVIPF